MITVDLDNELGFKLNRLAAHQHKPVHRVAVEILHEALTELVEAYALIDSIEAAARQEVECGAVSLYEVKRAKGFFIHQAANDELLL